MNPLVTILFFFGLFEIGMMVTVWGAGRLMKVDEQEQEKRQAHTVEYEWPHTEARASA
ncbi:MAG: hypothetical protein NTZ05_10930 [Chloroflexi bacterium]|nr:hypothetical protein [Chloroflexota bacterium]